jgi:hypothetical protein
MHTSSNKQRGWLFRFGWLIGLVLALQWAVVSQASQPYQEPESVTLKRKEWVERLDSFPPAPTLTAAELDAYLAPFSDPPPKPHAMGFGGSTKYYWLQDSLFIRRFRVVAFENRIVAIDVEVFDDQGEVNKAMARFLGPQAKEIDIDGVLYRDPEITARFNETVMDALGFVEEATLSPDPAKIKILAGLLDPLKEVTIGYICSFCGTEIDPTPERQAMKELVAGRQTAILRRILRSANPEARLYADKALRKLQASGEILPAIDLQAMAIVEAMDVPVNACFCADGDSAPSASKVLRIESCWD